jgi:hypothetical protein
MAFFDSLPLACAVVLFAACAGSWLIAAPLPARARLYLRFAAVLFAAIAVSVPLRMSDDVAVFLLPLASASLAIAALARFAAPLPVLVTTLALVASLFAGLFAMLLGMPMLALVLVIISGLTIVAAALHDTAIMACLAGLSVLGAGLVLLEQGSGGGFLLFAAAALMGATRSKTGRKNNQLLRSSNSA